MPLYLRTDFAELCGKSRGYISQYISRGKLTMSGDYIDTDVTENNEMMVKWLAQKVEDDQNQSQAEPEPKPKKKKKSQANKKHAAPDKKILPPPDVKPVVVDPENTISVLDRKKAMADIELKESNLRLNQLKEAKLRGENIPTKMVSEVISMLGKSFQASYKNGAEQLMQNLMHELKIAPEIVAKYKGKLIDQVNKSHDDGISEAKLGVKNIIDQISDIDIERENNE